MANRFWLFCFVFFLALPQRDCESQELSSSPNDACVVTCVLTAGCCWDCECCVVCWFCCCTWTWLLPPVVLLLESVWQSDGVPRLNELPAENTYFRIVVFCFGIGVFLISTLLDYFQWYFCLSFVVFLLLLLLCVRPIIIRNITRIMANKSRCCMHVCGCGCGCECIVCMYV